MDMKGTLTVIKTDGTIEKTDFDRATTLDDISPRVGGWIELIPYFNKYDGKPCIAYCNEESKIMRPPLAPNPTAQRAWNEAFGRVIIEDFLCGDVVVVQGDKEFMEAQ